MNNEEKAINQIGINIVVVDETTGEVLDSKSFNTFDNEVDADSLVAYLDSIEDGRYVLVGIKDEGSRLLKGSIRDKFQELGSTESFSVDFRDSWAMIFQKGRDTVPVEQHSNDGEARVTM